ncbi:unnamed protein product, partial [Prorocentrum cordatum]
ERRARGTCLGGAPRRGCEASPRGVRGLGRSGRGGRRWWRLGCPTYWTGMQLR